MDALCDDGLTIVMTTHHPHRALPSPTWRYRSPLKRVDVEHYERETATNAPILILAKTARDHSQRTVGAE
ncbi:hypothetical protein [Methylosinus sp. LW4]|uniref:hypothetical protein n=1 Tax=Methylosinus sp. LW4 TaxID=136993 RepID=UPI000368F0CC|nr:hypothetical protein [Methylosinus sp. LW4]